MIDSFEILSVSPSATVSSDEAITLYNKGVDATNLGNYDEAIQYYDRALEIDPNNASALENKGWTLYLLGRHNEAIEYYDRALEIDPNNAPRLNGKGLVLDALGRHNEAIEYYDRALQISPNDAVILGNKGWALYSLENYDEAIQYYDRSLAIDPNNVNALNEKGLTLVALGRHNEAIEYYDRALQISPNDAVILDNKDLALAAINSGQGIDIQSRIPIQKEGNQTDDVQSVGGFLQYQNPSLGITMQYPSNWQQEPGDSDPVVVHFSSPQESNNDVFPDLLFISIANSENTPLDENVATRINNLSQTLSDFTPIESNPTTLAGNPAHRLVFAYTEPEIGPMESMQILTVKDNILYTFTYLAEQSKYVKYLPTALDMLKSIEIGPPPQSNDGSGGGQENAPPAQLRPF